VKSRIAGKDVRGGPSGTERLVISGLYTHRTDERGKHRAMNIMIGAG